MLIFLFGTYRQPGFQENILFKIVTIDENQSCADFKG